MQPFRALFTAVRITDTSGVTPAASPLRHLPPLPSAMFTRVRISATVTELLPSQSPRQMAVGVGAGMIGTAMMAQCGEAKLHDIVTVAVPRAMLPAPDTPGLLLTEAWYCWVCPTPVAVRVVSGLVPIASRTIVPVALETLTLAGVPVSAELVAAVPSGVVGSTPTNDVAPLTMRWGEGNVMTMFPVPAGGFSNLHNCVVTFFPLSVTVPT